MANNTRRRPHDACLRPRPTLHAGVLMRSRLEAQFAEWCGSWGVPWEYEPCAFQNGGQYLPDFRLREIWCTWLSRPATVYVEVKPPPWENDAAAIARTTAELGIVVLAEPQAVAIVAVGHLDRNTVYIYDKHGRYDDAHEGPLLVPGWWMHTRRDFGLAIPLGAPWLPWPQDYWVVDPEDQE